MKFQVLDGKHQVFVPVDQDNNPGMSVLVDIYVKGDVVETDRDLTKTFNRPGVKKFARVSDDQPVKCSRPDSGRISHKDAEVVEPPSIEPMVNISVLSPQTSEIEDAFTGLTVKELRDLAAEKIDLGKAKKKSEILEILRKQVGE